MTRRLDNAWRNALTALGFVFVLSCAAALFSDERGDVPDLNQDWIVADLNQDDSSPFNGIVAVGRIVRVDSLYVDSEDRVAKTTSRRERTTITSVFLKSSRDADSAADLSRLVRSVRDERDHVWLNNGDDFSCDFSGLDKRFAYLRAFDSDFKIPRGRVAAIRFRGAISKTDED